MAEPAYFDTPERTERLQLLIHLVNNTRDLLYLRGPHGAGKTRFAQQLARLVASDFQVVWLSAGSELPLSEQLVAQIGLSQEDTQELELVLQSENDKPVLLIVDDADGLGPADLEQLQTPDRPETRILLLGTGSLVYPGNGQRVQFVDLPPFTEAQSRAFVEAQGLPGGGVDERVVVSLYRAARGQPGPLLDALAGLPAAEGQSAGKSPGFSWRWGLLGGGLAVVILAALVFQGQINQWFAPPPLPSPVPEGVIAGSPSDVAEEEPATVAVPASEGTATPISRISPATESTGAGSPASATLPSPPAGLADMDSGPGDGEAADPILDAVIDAAISAAEGLPQKKNGAGLAEHPADSAPRPPAEPASPGESVARVEADSSPIAAPKSVVERAQAPTPAALEEAPAIKTPVKEGLAWLHAQPAAHYTLQLVGSRDRTSIDKFIRQHRITGPHAVFVRDLNGRPWYSLVSGSYPDREAALAGLAKLPRGLSGAWPRTFASIQELLHSSGTPAANK